MSKLSPHVGDVGVAMVESFRDQDAAPIDLTTATTITVKLVRPDKTTTTKTATVDGDAENGQAIYTTSSTSDLNMAGTWVWQFYVALSGGAEFHGDEFEFTVLPNR